MNGPDVHAVHTEVRRGTEDAVPLTPARPLAAPTLFPGPSPLVCDSTVCRALWPPDALLRDLEVADAHHRGLR